MISAVVFDAFGTLLDTRLKLHPFRQLLREGAASGRRVSSQDVRLLMSNPWSLEEAANQLGIGISSGRLKALQSDLERELESIVAFPDGVEAVALLRAAGVRLGICSNLSEPYGAAVLSTFPGLDGYALSYEVGAMKPDAVIYKAICESLRVVPGHLFADGNEQVAMVGDSIKCDRDGPRAVGMLGFHLDRRGDGSIRDLIHFAELIMGSRDSRSAT